jgi:hypothetical protein
MTTRWVCKIRIQIAVVVVVVIMGYYWIAVFISAY